MKMSEDPGLFPGAPKPGPRKSNPPKKVFIICPVRKLKPKVRELLRKYIKGLEDQGCVVYWPYLDNPHQKSDKIGIEIITCNRYHIIWADEIHIFFDPESSGSIFDFGMLFMRLESFEELKIKIINPEDVRPTEEKSFPNIILELAKQFAPEADDSR